MHVSRQKLKKQHVSMPNKNLQELRLKKKKKKEKKKRLDKKQLGCKPKKKNIKDN